MLKEAAEKLFNLHLLDQETLLFRVVPRFLGEILRKYFRVEVEGLEHIPKTGPVIIAPNHSGFSGFDAIVLNDVLIKQARRIPRVLTHHLWFLTPTTSFPAQKMGFVEATFENGVKYLKKKNMIILFPEGENGNFKPTSQMYQLQEFKRGFVRMALQTEAWIVPTLIIGAEESNINLKTLKFAKFLRGPILPLPLNVVPLPVKWKIKFLEPMKLPYKVSAASDRELVHEIANDIQETMQATLRRELKTRSSQKKASRSRSRLIKI
jgi:1-acyl-sn-glycerol-3-phosphate acyltransferase